jgi:hypothetical protein
MTTVAIPAIGTCDDGWFRGPSPSRSTGDNAKGMVNEGGVANRTPRKRQQGIRESKGKQYVLKTSHDECRGSFLPFLDPADYLSIQCSRLKWQ